MSITIEIPQDLLNIMSEAQLASYLQQEAEKLLVRKRYGDDIADAGVTLAEIQEAKKRAWDEVGKHYIKDMISPS